MGRVRIFRLALAGLGNVGSAVLRVLDERADDLRDRHGVEVRLVGVAELGGAAADPAGLDLAAVRRTVAGRRPVAGLPGGRAGLDPVGMLAEAGPDVLFEATPVDLVTGGAGLAAVRAALAAGCHVVLANKGPLALAYPELARASDLIDGFGLAHTRPGPRLRFSACVGGALPAVNLGTRDLAGCRITRIEAVLNGTSQGILRALETGETYAGALADAQRRGVAEADPGLDVDGHDAAAKLVITVNAVLGSAVGLADVAVTGIRGVRPSDAVAAVGRGERITLLGVAEPGPDGVPRLTVAPTALPVAHPLARLEADEMAVAFYSDEVDRLVAASWEPRPDPAAAAMVRDLLEIARSG